MFPLYDIATRLCICKLASKQNVHRKKPWPLGVEPATLFAARWFRCRRQLDWEDTEGKKYLTEWNILGVKLRLAWVHIVQTAQWLQRSEPNMPQPGWVGSKLFDWRVREGTSTTRCELHLEHHLFGFIILLLSFTKQQANYCAQIFKINVLNHQSCGYWGKTSTPVVLKFKIKKNIKGICLRHSMQWNVTQIISWNQLLQLTFCFV